MTDFTALFAKLNDFSESLNKTPMKENKECCYNPEYSINDDTLERVCSNCGTIVSQELEEQTAVKSDNIYVADNYFSGMIVGAGAQSLKTTMLYNNSANRYRTSTLFNSYADIDSIIKELKIEDKEVITGSKLLYKKLYLYEDEVKTRGKIKYGLYYYCIINALIKSENASNFDIFNIFKKLNYIDISHYNKAISKINPEHYDLLYINENMEEYMKIIQKLKLNISVNELIKKYNFYINKNLNLNNNSLLKGCIYQLIIEKEGLTSGFNKLFSKSFNTTTNTIEKIIKTFSTTHPH